MREAPASPGGFARPLPEQEVVELPRIQWDAELSSDIIPKPLAPAAEGQILGVRLAAVRGWDLLDCGDFSERFQGQ